MLRRAALLSNTALTPKTKGVRSGYILDDWDQIICNVKAGKAQEYYQEGDYKEIDLGEYGMNELYISSWNPIENQSHLRGYFLDEAMTIPAQMCWRTRYLLTKTYNLNETDRSTTANWSTSQVKQFFNQTLYNSLPSFLKEAIVPCWVDQQTAYRPKGKSWQYTYVKDQGYLFTPWVYNRNSYFWSSMGCYNSCYQDHFPLTAIPPKESGEVVLIDSCYDFDNYSGGTKQGGFGTLGRGATPAGIFGKKIEGKVYLIFEFCM